MRFNTKVVSWCWVGSVGLCCLIQSPLRSHAEEVHVNADRQMEVELKPSSTPMGDPGGAGFGDILWGPSLNLKVRLKAPINYQIKDSKIRIKGSVLWGPPSGIPNPPTEPRSYRDYWAIGIR